MKNGIIWGMTSILILFLAQATRAEEVSLAPVADCAITPMSPDQNLAEGKYFVIGSSTRRSEPGNRYLVKFDLSRIPAEAKIKMAALILRPFKRGGVHQQSAGPKIGAYRLLSDWQENSATWINRNSGLKWEKEGAEGSRTDRAENPIIRVTNEDEESVFDVAGDVQTWQKECWKTNYGWLVKTTASDGTSGYDSFVSREGPIEERPLLVILYDNTDAIAAKSATLKYSSPGNTQGFIFARGETVTETINNPTADIVLDFNSLLLKPNMTWKDIGIANIDSIKEILEEGYRRDQVILFTQGHVYALKLADGKYAVIEILSLNIDQTQRSLLTIRYKYLPYGTRTL